ncbi:MAG: hypothetical protein HY721_27765 [Planctomycetes bacterium]|nr:hypothetical protein [Planctomycetota bacterium]
MDGLTCDGCGETLLLDSEVRYVLRVEGFAAYDPLEITRQDLERDLEEEMRRLLDVLAKKGAEEAQDEVHRTFQFDLCPRCWRDFLQDPLSAIRRPAGGG